jgi:hypothetical protein
MAEARFATARATMVVVARGKATKQSGSGAAKRVYFAPLAMTLTGRLV